MVPAAIIEPPHFKYLPDLLPLFLLCFVGGFIDTSCWFDLFGLFVGSITGNVVLAASSVTGLSEGVIPRLVITVVFCASSMVGHFVAACMYMYGGYSQRKVLKVLLIMEVCALIALWVSGVLLSSSLTSLVAPNVTFVGSMGAIAIGFQASAVKEANLSLKQGHYPSTNVMTTTITNAGSLVGSYLLHLVGACGLLPKTAASPRAPLTPEEWKVLLPVRRAAAGRAVWPIFAFTCGCCLGAGLQYLIGFHSTCVPVAALLVLIADTALPNE